MQYLKLTFVAVALFSSILSGVVRTNAEVENNAVSHKNPLLLDAPTWSANFDASLLNMTMAQKQVINVTITNIDPAWGEEFEIHVLPAARRLLKIEHVIYARDIPRAATNWTTNFTVEAILLGSTQIYLELHRPNAAPEQSMEQINVIITHVVGPLDILFKVVIGCFVSIMYVNFGAALELDALKRILLRPVGPAIGVLGHFLVMPLLSFAIGYFLFHDMFELRLGLFITGSTPCGGFSNVLTVILNGNLNLAVTMTALSNLVSFGLMPLWIFTLGAYIFRDGQFVIPYGTIGTMSCSLLLPLCVGVAVKKYKPELAKKMLKLLKPISICMVLLISVCAFSINSYLFKLFTAKIMVASCALPWLGYIIGWTIATICRQTPKDALTIAIETGMQNTGIAIFMLNFTLPQPLADMTSAVPVAIAMVTPLPLFVLYLIQRCCYRTSIEDVEPAPTKEGKVIEVEKIVEKV